MKLTFSNNYENIKETNEIVFCVCPIYNQPASKIIEYMLNQKNNHWALLLINNNSKYYIDDFNNMKKKYMFHHNIGFFQNDKTLNIANCINIGRGIFINTKKFTYFTCLSDCNIYHHKFIENILISFKNRHIDFVYTNFYEHFPGERFAIRNGSRYNNCNDLINNYKNNIACAAWSKNAINLLGRFDNSFQGCEIFDYIFCSFKVLSPIKIFYQNKVTLTCRNKTHSNFPKEIHHIEKYFQIIKDKMDAISKDIITIVDLKCINIENKKSYDCLINHNNGDNINETNFINNITDEGKTLYFNNKFIEGDKELKPEITISRNKNFSDIINKENVFLSPIPYKKESNGLYFITKSMINAIQDRSSLLYPSVFPNELFDEINRKHFFLQEQSVNKNWYNWKTDEEVKELKLQHFPENAFVICICGRIAINSYPKSLLESIKTLRNQGYNIYLLALTQFEVRPQRLTQGLYDEITSYDWIKSFTVEKKEVLNYFRFCDVLASTYRDYCNHVGGSNKIKEYLLCDKPILCSRGKEREQELGKDYFGLYDCETCSTVPPLCWTEEYINNPTCYVEQYNKYFKNSDLNGGVKSENNFSLGFIKQIIEKKCIIAVIPVFGREPLLKYTIRRAYNKNKVNHVIVLGESESEEKVAKTEGAIFIKHQNRPLGKKWNAGFMFSKRFNPDALLFIGSRDWISNNWIDRAYTEILNGAGYVGKMGFDMIDFKNEKRMCKWFGYICDRKNETIGIGRLVSRKLLDAVNFCPFPDEKDSSMDYGMYLHCINNKMSIKILDNDSLFLSISCDLWKNMHEFDMHYYGCMPNCDDYYRRDKSSCINVRKESGIQFCDLHNNRLGCKADIDFFYTYRSLYQNGRLYNNDDIKRLHIEFPEINEFYNDYLKLKT